MFKSVKKLWALALAASFAVGGQLTATSAAYAEGDSAVTNITSGKVVWGLKESWRNYAGLPEASGGLVINSDGLYEFPVTGGTFNTATKELNLRLGGQIHYRLYCDEGTNENCKLDSVFKDFRIVISESEQVIRATYSGKNRDNPNQVDQSTDEIMAVLDVDGVTPTNAESSTRWDISNTYAGTGLKLYAAGTPLDPVAISYEGPGGAPDLSEKFVLGGTPKFALNESAKWDGTDTISNTNRSNVVLFPSQQPDVIHAIDVSSGNVVVRAHNQQTLAVIAEKDFAENAASGAGANTNLYSKLSYAFDSVSDTVFVGVKKQNSKPVKIFALRYVNGTYEVSEVGTVDKYKAPAMVWNSHANELGLFAATGKRNEKPALIRFEKSESGWQMTATEVSLPAYQTEGEPTGSPFKVSNTTGTLSVLRDGSYLFAGDNTHSSKGQGQGNITFKYPLISIKPSADGVTVDFVEGSMPPLAGKIDFPYTLASTLSDGSLLLGGSTWSNTYSYLDIAEGSAKMISDHTRVTPVEESARGSAAIAVDRNNNLEYLYNATSYKVAIIKDRKIISTFPVGEALAEHVYMRNGFAVARDGALILNTKNAEGKRSLIRYDLVATAATVSEQPKSQTVKLTDGAVAKAANLSVAFEGDAQVQWQQKPRGVKRFTDVSGATAKTFAPEVGLEHDGTEYRAVISNAAGAVASDVATVTVVSTPRFSQQPPATVTVEEGAKTTLTAAADEAVAGQLEWQRYDAATQQWVTVVADETHELAANTLTLQGTAELNGAKYRAVLSNEHGATVSTESLITVVPVSVIPPEGRKRAGVVFDWEVSEEVQSKPPFGVANYLSAGESDGKAETYAATSGNVSILQRVDGVEALASYDTRGAFVGKGKQFVRLSEGVATEYPDSRVEIAWEGTFSVNMYAGLVPFTITNPRLTVAADGSAVMTADLSGYAGDISQPGVTTKLETVKDVVIAAFKNVTVDLNNGFTAQPDYREVAVNIPADSGATAQKREGEHWGSWPQVFVDFQLQTGLSSYWYSSGSSFDSKKAPAVMLFGAARPPVAAPGAGEQPGAGGQPGAGEQSGAGAQPGGDGGQQVKPQQSAQQPSGKPLKATGSDIGIAGLILFAVTLLAAGAGALAGRRERQQS